MDKKWHELNEYGLPDSAYWVLFAIGLWIGSVVGELDGESVYIGNHFKPDVHELFYWTFETDDFPLVTLDEFKEGHEQLRKKKLLQSQQGVGKPYCAGRYCSWLPTEECMSFMRDLFRDSRETYPPWALAADDPPNSPPFFMDPNALMEHRKGVELAAHRGFWVDTVRYPQTPASEPAPDVHYDSDESPARVEVLTDHNDRESWTQKFKAWAHTDRGTIWLFSNRQTMVEFYNHIMTHEDLIGTRYELDLPNGEIEIPPGHMPPERMRQRLLKARKEPRFSNPNPQLTFTIGELLEMEPARFRVLVSIAIYYDFAGIDKNVFPPWAPDPDE